MEILREILLTLHLVGMAIIVGGYFTVIRSPKVMPGMLHGSYLQLITGLLLMGLAEMGDGDVNHMKLGIKLVVAILVTVFAFIGNRKQKAFAAGGTPSEGAAATAVKNPSATMAHLTFAFAIINVLVAVFVH
ncbi:hypothetical protein [Brevibacterium renqingii]|uniref:hypothetical protein n=1 Tax=Brevibacterium renqingii TaxID=2776916 RepID=UPI001ADF082E|nr:hypothetical protein [Brevibacterium renqingii]